MARAEETIRVSTETEKCFVTIKEFKTRLHRGEFPNILQRLQSRHGRLNTKALRAAIAYGRKSYKLRSGKLRTRSCDPYGAILKQKNASKHWEIDLISAAKEDKRLRMARKVTETLRSNPLVQKLRRIEEAQERQLTELRGRIEAIIEEQRSALMNEVQ